LQIDLPGRAESQEDAWLADLDDAPAEAIVDAVRAAITARRPRLAARLVGLLGEGADADDPDIARALRAAEFLCLKGRDVVVEADLEELLGVLRDRRRARFKHRHDARRDPKKRFRWWSRYRR
jgi:hypothetical protein